VPEGGEKALKVREGYREREEDETAETIERDKVCMCMLSEN